MKKKIISIICLILAALVAGYFLIPRLRNADRYTMEKYGFSIQMPKKWVVKKEESDVVIIGISPLENDFDAFQESVNVSTGPLKGVRFNDYFYKNIQALSQILPNFQQKSTGDIRIGGKLALWVNYSYYLGDMKVETMIYMIEHNGIAYVITCMAQAKNFEKYKRTFALIAKSFRLLNKE